MQYCRIISLDNNNSVEFTKFFKYVNKFSFQSALPQNTHTGTDLLTLSQTSPGFLRVCSTSLLKTPWEKKKLLVTSNFSFSHSVFYPFGELYAIFIKFETVVCKLFQFGRV